jgi:pyruvate formate lyase activating enzyme
MDFVGIEKLSFVDWEDKIVCTLFMQGCNFRCPFCHNENLVLNINKKIKGIPFDSILDFLKLRKGKLEGVVITGGEPTLMPDLVDKIRKIKSLGYPIKLDTNGSNPQILKFLVENHLIDYVAMDIKNSIKKYPETIGLKKFNFENTRESISYFLSNAIPYEFRTTLVSEFHDEESIDEMGQLIKGAKKIYLQHFKNSDTCINKNLHDISYEKTLQFSNILKKYVGFVGLRGY